MEPMIMFVNLLFSSFDNDDFVFSGNLACFLYRGTCKASILYLFEMFPLSFVM